VNCVRVTAQSPDKSGFHFARGSNDVLFGTVKLELLLYIIRATATGHTLPFHAAIFNKIDGNGLHHCFHPADSAASKLFALPQSV